MFLEGGVCFSALTGSGHRIAPAPFDAAARLRRLASALPAGIAERERWVARIAALAGDSASVEESLAAFDEELLSACEERKTGVFLSSASPVHDTNAVGMQSVVPLGFSRMYAGLVTSQAV